MKLFEFVSISIVVMLSVWIAYGFIFESGVESPPFDLISKTKQFSIRYYSNLNLAITDSSSQNSSFRKLFKFIDGENSNDQKISMTAPVILDSTHMMFVLPTSLSSPPTPTNQNVNLKTLQTLKVAVISFSGYSSQAPKYKQKLQTYLDKANILYTSNSFLCQYNSPWVFPMLRKNEIWIELAN
tara:strand:+ start:406 stop:957 length:552 start_codon:yes stop_codon:yes gene_type:complete